MYTKKNGYIKVMLSKFGKPSNHSVHRLVAVAFIPNINHKTQINHVNGCKAFNYASNLEWCTPSENILHAHKTGLIKTKGENSNASKLCNIDVLEIRQRLAHGELPLNLSIEYNVTKESIYNIRARRTWKHI